MDEFSFAFKADEVEGAVSQILRQDLDDCRTVEHRVDNFVNSALATLTNFFDDTIMEEEFVG